MIQTDRRALALPRAGDQIGGRQPGGGSGEVASFGRSAKVHAGFNADGASDVLWRHVDIGYNTIWPSASSTPDQAMSGVGLGWQIAGLGDFDGDRRADLFLRNPTTGLNVIPAAQLAGPWVVAGVADFNADRSADILWRKTDVDYNTIWLSGNVATGQAVTGVGGQA